MKLVGTQDRSEIELDPAQAYRRGRKLDLLLRATMPPVMRGVFHATHDAFMRIDEQRQVDLARTLNLPKDHD